MGHFSSTEIPWTSVEKALVWHPALALKSQWKPSDMKGGGLAALRSPTFYLMDWEPPGSAGAPWNKEAADGPSPTEFAQPGQDLGACTRHPKLPPCRGRRPGRGSCSSICWGNSPAAPTPCLRLTLVWIWWRPPSLHPAARTAASASCLCLLSF